MNASNDHLYDVAIIGGGLAGLTTAIQLARQGRSVVLFEKKDFPRHKVCGEYISNEVLPVLQSFGIDPFQAGATRISKLELSAPSGTKINTPLSLGAFGLSRYCFDKLLADKAVELGVKIHTRTLVTSTRFHNDGFEISTHNDSVSARFVVGAFGKHSNLNRLAESPGHNDAGKFVAVKRHVSLDFPDDLVALHNFKGGYCGISRVEEQRVNICYLAQAADIKRAGGIGHFEKSVLFQNSHLAQVFDQAKPLFKRPITISNFSFGAKKAVTNHILNAGDAAGMITPLCGNGMAMAIHSGYRLGNLLNETCSGSISRNELEATYAQEWKARFSNRMWWGNRLQSLFGKPLIANTALGVLSRIPAITPMIIRRTHGEPTFILSD